METWAANYGRFLTAKNDWVQDQYVYAQNVLTGNVMASAGMNAEAAISQTMRVMEKKPDSFVTVNLEGKIETLLGESSLAGLLALGGKITDRASGSASVVSRGQKQNASIADSLAAAERFMTQLTSEMRDIASTLAAGQARKQLRMARDQYIKRLEAENKGMSEWQAGMVRAAGYTWGPTISRKVIKNSTVFSNVYETQTVHRYRDFVLSVPEFALSLDDATLASLDDHAIMLLVKQSEQEMSAWGETIFGKVDDDGQIKQWRIPRSRQDAATTEYQSISENDRVKEILAKLTEYEEKDISSLSDSSRKAYQKLLDSLITVRDGALGQHIGWAPVFKDGNALDLKSSRSSNLSSKGSGEMGAIMTDFQWNAMMASMGLASMDTAIWDKPLWDDTGMAFEAPSIRSTVEITTAIYATLVVTVLTAGMGTGPAMLAGAALTTAINLADDALFAALDLNGGYKSPAEIGNTFGKKAMTTILTSYVGMYAGPLGTAANTLGGAGAVVGNIAIAGAQSYVNSVGSAYIGAMDFTKVGTSDFMDWNTANKSWTSKDTLLGLGSSLISAGVTQGMNAWNLGDNAIKVDGFNSGQIGDMQKMNMFAGSLASTGFMYGMTGEATFNVARLGWGGGVGVLEMSVGKNGFSSRFGMGGMDISLGTLASVGRGMQNWDTNNKINTVARNSNMDIGTVLRTQWGFGDDMAKDQLAQLFSGSAVLRAGSGSGVAQTELINGQRVITLNGYRDGMSREEQLAMGITLQHEAHRDGIVTADNHLETRTAVLSHTAIALRMANDNRYTASMNAVIAGNTTLQNDLSAYFLSKNPENAGVWEAYVDGMYDNSADYWKINKDGKLVNDGKSYLTVELADGSTKIFGKDETSMAAALVHYLGTERTMELLGTGGSLSDADKIDTIVDVMNVSRTEAEYLTKNPEAYLAKYENLTQYQKDQILGETLLKSNGVSFNQGKGWLNADGTHASFALSTNTFADYSIGVQSLGNHAYEYFTISGVATRSADAFKSLVMGADGKWDENIEHWRNTSITFTKRDLKGNQIGEVFTQDGWNTVDTGYNQIKGVYDQPYRDPVHGMIQGNTVNSDFLIYMDNAGQKWGHDKSFVINNATTIGGERIGGRGTVFGSNLLDNANAPWRLHAAGKGTNDGCWVLLNAVGYDSYYKNLTNPNSGASRFNAFTSQMQLMGLYNGLNMHIQLINMYTQKNYNYRKW